MKLHCCESLPAVSRSVLAAAIALAIFSVSLTCCAATTATTATTSSTTPAAPPALVPKPAKLTMLAGSFALTSRTTIMFINEEARGGAEMLASYLRPATGYPLIVRGYMLDSDVLHFSVVTLEIDAKKKAALGEEGYTLDSVKDSLKITAAAPAGLFYGVQTLRQMLPPAIFANALQKGAKWEIPACAIEDKPRFAWRGFMLDYSRHFFTLEYTKHLLDAMAMNKLNILQMHLADDDGWRIEIKKYPKLTEVGAWRGTDCALPNTRPGETHTRYGGFFTQAQIREIVAYAARLHINIVPEIDIPGHSLAITTAYPETKPGAPETAPVATGKPVRINAISPANEGNFQMVDDIIAEVAELFPFEYVHVGGDEVNFKLWQESPEVKALIEREKLDGLAGAQVYFTKRLEQILAKHHKKMIGWNEILNGKLARGTAIMSWTGVEPGYEAVRMGFPVVMVPGPHAYFDMSYVKGDDEPPGHSWAGLIDTAKVYALDPMGEKGLDEAQGAKILGVQANLWSEFITEWKAKNGWAEFKTNGDHADYKAFPRLCAMAEIGWTPQALRDYGEFTKRLGPVHLTRLQNAGVNFRVPPPDPVRRKGAIVILPPYPGAEIRYTLDGSDPLGAKEAKVWDGKPLAGDGAGLRLRTMLDGRPSPMISGARYEPVGAWTKGTLSTEFAPREFDVSEALHEPGTWQVTFHKSVTDLHRVAIKGVELIAGGQVIASDMHEGTTAASGKGGYRLEVKGPLAGKLTLRVTMKEVTVNRRGESEPLKTSGEVLLSK